jgi:hypothetical protein
LRASEARIGLEMRMPADRNKRAEGWGLLARRVAAYLLDILLLFAVLAPLGPLILGLLGATPRSGPEITLRVGA